MSEVKTYWVEPKEYKPINMNDPNIKRLVHSIALGLIAKARKNKAERLGTL